MRVCRTLYSSAASDVYKRAVLKQWDYDLSTLQNDADYMATLNAYGSKDELDAVLGKAVYDGSEVLVSAEAFTLSYFIDDRTAENGSDADSSEGAPINEGCDEDFFLATTESISTIYATLSVDYRSGRSFSDEFGGAITGDLLLVQISYVVVFLFLGASMDRFIPGPESR